MSEQDAPPFAPPAYRPEDDGKRIRYQFPDADAFDFCLRVQQNQLFIEAKNAITKLSYTGSFTQQSFANHSQRNVSSIMKMLNCALRKEVIQGAELKLHARFGTLEKDSDDWNSLPRIPQPGRAMLLVLEATMAFFEDCYLFHLAPAEDSPVARLEEMVRDCRDVVRKLETHCAALQAENAALRTLIETKSPLKNYELTAMIPFFAHPARSHFGAQTRGSKIELIWDHSASIQRVLFDAKTSQYLDQQVPDDVELATGERLRVKDDGKTTITKRSAVEAPLNPPPRKAVKSNNHELIVHDCQSNPPRLLTRIFLPPCFIAFETVTMSSPTEVLVFAKIEIPTVNISKAFVLVYTLYL